MTTTISRGSSPASSGSGVLGASGTVQAKRAQQSAMALAHRTSLLFGSRLFNVELSGIAVRSCFRIDLSHTVAKNHHAFLIGDRNAIVAPVPDWKQATTQRITHENRATETHFQALQPFWLTV